MNTTSIDNDDTTNRNRVRNLELEYMNEQGTRIKIYSEVKDPSDITNAVSDLWCAIRELNNFELVFVIRDTCYFKKRVYFANDTGSAKMERMMITVAANHPLGIDLDLLCSELEIERKAARAYITSGNNWTSQYLHLEENSLVTTTSSGIRIASERLDIK